MACMMNFQKSLNNDVFEIRILRIGLELLKYSICGDYKKYIFIRNISLH